jgi:hypothetical protein
MKLRRISVDTRLILDPFSLRTSFLYDGANKLRRIMDSGGRKRSAQLQILIDYVLHGCGLMREPPLQATGEPPEQSVEVDFGVNCGRIETAVAKQIGAPFQGRQHPVSESPQCVPSFPNPRL